MRIEKLKAARAEPAPDGRPRRRSVAEIKADLDAITAEFERIHGRSLIPEQEAEAKRRQRRRSA